MTLVLAADASSPFPLSLLPLACKIIIGYLGMPGYTPHVWTKAEVDGTRNVDYTWLGVWVPPQGDMALANPDVHAMWADGAAAMLGCKQTNAIFVDIERHSWDVNPSGVVTFVGRWKKAMMRRGWRRPYAYVPAVAGFDWIAKPANTRPASLPPSVIGQQYRYDAAAGAYDLSVFDPVALGVSSSPVAKGVQIEGQIPMFIVRDASNGKEYLQSDDGKLHYLGMPESVQAYRDAGVPEIDGIDPSDIRTLLNE